MPVENETRVDAKTGEPEIYKGGAWITDWDLLTQSTDGSASVWLGSGVTTTGVANNGNLPRGTRRESAGTGITEDPGNNHSWILTEGTWFLSSYGFNSTNSSNRAGGHVWLVDGAETNIFATSYGDPPVVRPALAVAIVPAGETKTVTRRNRAGHSTSNGNSGHVFIRKESIRGDAGQPGLDGRGIDHNTRTSGDGSPGTTDVYTMWGDAAETINLGTFDIAIPSGATTVLLADGGSTERSGGSFTMQVAGINKTWADVIAEYDELVFMAVETQYDSMNVSSRYFTQGLQINGNYDIDIWNNATSNYRLRIVSPALTSTTCRTEGSRFRYFTMYGIKN